MSCDGEKERLQKRGGKEVSVLSFYGSKSLNFDSDAVSTTDSLSSDTLAFILGIHFVCTFLNWLIKNRKRSPFTSSREKTTDCCVLTLQFKADNTKGDAVPQMHTK